MTGAQAEEALHLTPHWDIVTCVSLVVATSLSRDVVGPTVSLLKVTERPLSRSVPADTGAVLLFLRLPEEPAVLVPAAPRDVGERRLGEQDVERCDRRSGAGEVARMVSGTIRRPEMPMKRPKVAGGPPCPTVDVRS